jgi:formate dehydrogenase maturation protein FdhE
LSKELVCENCGKTWQITYPSMALDVRVESCQECGRFKFHLEPIDSKSKIPANNTHLK